MTAMEHSCCAPALSVLHHGIKNRLYFIRFKNTILRVAGFTPRLWQKLIFRKFISDWRVNVRSDVNALNGVVPKRE
jgi:hypothetical protein